MMDDFLTVFTNFKTILCVCPNCRALPRLSELQIFSSKKTPKDWMDDWQQRMNGLEEKVNEFSFNLIIITKSWGHQLPVKIAS